MSSGSALHALLVAAASASHKDGTSGLAAQLQGEKESIERQMVELAERNSKAFTEATRCSRDAHRELAVAEEKLTKLQSTLQGLRRESRVLMDKGGDVREKLEALSQLGAVGDHAQDLVDVPQIQEACAAGEAYDEALDLMAYINKLAIVRSEISLVRQLHAASRQQAERLQERVLARLAGPLQLAECLRMVALLRRLSPSGPHSAGGDLRSTFLACRGRWLDQVIREIDTSAGDYEYLRRLTDAHRLHLFDIAMQYRAVFPDQPAAQQRAPAGSAAAPASAALQAWAHDRVLHFLSAFEARLPGVKDGASLASLLDHAMYCGVSLGRVGLDFRPLLEPMFAARALVLFTDLADAAVLASQQQVQTQAWGAALPSTGSAGLAAHAAQGAPARKGAAESVPPDAPAAQPPREVLSFPFLASLTNGVLGALNELRQVPVVALGPRLAEALTDVLAQAAEVLGGVPGVRKLAGRDVAAHEAACGVLARSVAPHLRGCFARLYPDCADRVDVERAMAPLEPYLGAAT
ncbi:unnamed protein product [Pedinophyceae sp. YPF-701]|nr:unnamed protein product [Pedinophyceae sp. YPF-701]